MKEKHMKWVPRVVWPVFLVAIALLLLLAEGDLLWKVQALNLHLDTSLFYHEVMAVPGGPLSWFSTLFTEYFYHPWIGVGWLCLWWLLLMWLVKRAFRISDRWTLLTLIPVAIILVTIVDTGYWIYLLKLRGHFFVATIGTTVAAALLWGFRCLPAKYGVHAAYMLAVTAIGYPLMGTYALGATLVMAVWQWNLEKRRLLNAINSVVALAAIWLVPLLCYGSLYDQISVEHIYWVELPLFIAQNEHSSYYIPYYLLLLFFVVMAAAYSHIPMKRTADSAVRLVRWGMWQVGLVAVLAVGLVKTWYTDENFHHELAMLRCIDRQDWQGVLDEAALQQDEPTRAIVMMRNLALCRLGRQGNELFQYANGMKPYNAPFPMRTMLAVGPQMFYQYGLLNYGHRFCIEMGVEFGWGAEHCELLAKCAIMNGQERLARKYIETLKHTRYYTDRALHLEELLNHPERIANDQEMGPITHMLHHLDDLTANQDRIEHSIMNSLAWSPSSSDPVFLEQQLVASMWLKNWKLFWRHFTNYVQQHPDSVPRYYQEAAFLCCWENQWTDKNMDIFDQQVKDSFDAFARQLSTYDGLPLEEAREALRPSFGNTYYFDYYLMQYDSID